MGLNSSVKRIESNIISEKNEKQKEREKKEVLKNQQVELKQMLLYELINAKKEKINIYDDIYKDFAINNTMTEYEANIQSKEFLKLFEKSYKKEVQKYLLLNYYNISAQAEKIAKKQNENIEEYKKQIAIKKLELQREKIQQKMQQEKKQKIARNEAIALNITISIIVAIIKGFATVIGSIILVLGSIAAGFFGGMCKGK